MGAWRYCEKCGTGNSVPLTPTEDTTCSSCEAEMLPFITTKEWIELLLERIIKLEASND